MNMNQDIWASTSVNAEAMINISKVCATHNATVHGKSEKHSCFRLSHAQHTPKRMAHESTSDITMLCDNCG